ncbi:hypothetical protein [Paenibacillus rhizophilus]|uniref:Uncharacterized protein n=1 Tax=Paenibacillus rhizophilus TaxID=1850366 RepID=A0A3N9P3Q9_9BACL|nr:hypothetical protein [Paenibacillus rhizophilus]RQW10841.1 hypothetical protein EH198_13875 [Paenibacillus rhizophilus]
MEQRDRVARRKAPKLKIKEIVIILYLSEQGTEYSHKDLQTLLSLNFRELDNLVQKLIDNEYIKYTSYGGYIVTGKGESFLSQYNLSDFSVIGSLKDDHRYINMKPNFLDLYIPKDFKFKI